MLRWVGIALLFLGMGMASYDWAFVQDQPTQATTEVTAAEDGTGWPPKEASGTDVTKAEDGTGWPPKH